MDSKQLALLGKIKSPVVTLSEVYGLISQQILIGKMSIACLTKQAEYCKALKNAQDYTITLTTKKIELLEYLNKLREEQLKEFDENRQEECNALIANINELDEPNYEYHTISKQLESMKSEQNKLIEKINALQQSLPNEKVLDFYKVKPKLDSGMIDNCATESSAFD